MAGGPSASDDLESRIGGRWLLYAGVAILLVGVSFFLKYAFDNDWIPPATRVLTGAAAGLALVAGGWRVARHVERFGLALTGVGLVTLYLAAYSALAFYALVDQWTGFGAMFSTTLLATWLANRGRSQLLALIACIGGFLTPFLVSGSAHDTTLLLSYFLALALGVLVLVARQGWMAVASVGYVLTLGVLVSWATVNYADDDWAWILLCLTAFCAVFVGMWRVTVRMDGGGATLAAALLGTAPFFYHLAALAITSGHPPFFHVYLIVVTSVGLLLTTTPHRGWLRLLILLGTYLPLLGYLEYSSTSSLTSSFVTAIALATLHVVAMLDRMLRQERPLGLPDLLVLHLSMIGLFGLLSQILGPVAPDWRGGAGAVLALVSAGLWFIAERRDPVMALNAAGLSFTLVALATAIQFDGRVAVIGWAAEGAAAAWIGLRAPSRIFRIGGLALLALAAIRLSDGYFDSGASTAVIVNDRSLATLVIVVLAYLLARAWRLHRPADEAAGALPVGLETGASVLTMMWLSAEIAAYWDAQPRTLQAALSEELMRSLAWGAYGAALIVIGMWQSLASIRWIGMAVIGVTVVKVGIVDLSTLGGIYRVIGFLAIGVLLVTVSYLYQRTRTGNGARVHDGPGNRAAADRRAHGDDGVSP